jgi:MFS family permease
MARASGPGGRATRVRFLVLAMLCLATTFAYLTRVLASAVRPIGQEFGLDDQRMGVVLASFALGYFWFQVPGGLLGSWLGVRSVLAGCAALWSLACLGMTVAEGPAGLEWSRVALGLAQAALVPCCVQAIGSWFPDRSRGTASAVVGIGMQVGAVLGLGLTARLLRWFDWRQIYVGYSLASLAWAAAFYWIYREGPENHPLANSAECDLIRDGAKVFTDPGVSRPWLDRVVGVAVALFLSGAMWAYCVQAYCRAFGYEFFTTWFPTYLERSRGETLDAELLIVVPVIGFGLGGFVGGVLVDVIYRHTGSKWLSRCGLAAVSLALCAGCTLAVAWVADPVAAVVVLSLGSFLASLAGPPTWAVALDLGGRHSALVAGIMNLVGNIGAYYCPIAVAALFTHIQADEGLSGSQGPARYNPVLYLFVGVYLVGALAWLVLNPNRSATEPRRDKMILSEG